MQSVLPGYAPSNLLLDPPPEKATPIGNWPGGLQRYGTPIVEDEDTVAAPLPSLVAFKIGYRLRVTSCSIDLHVRITAAY